MNGWMDGRMYLFIYLSIYKKITKRLLYNSVYVTAENCDHDDDCILTTCSAGYEVDCHHVDHHHIDSKQCTCRAKGKEIEIMQNT